jgi:hypothetical protein
MFSGCGGNGQGKGISKKEVPHMHINRQIERFLIQYGVPATKFGRLVCNDPRLVHDMRRGRALGPAMASRAQAFMAAHARMIANEMERVA